MTYVQNLTPGVATIWELGHLYYNRMSSQVASVVEYHDGSQDSTAMPVDLSRKVAPAPRDMMQDWLTLVPLNTLPCYVSAFLSHYSRCHGGALNRVSIALRDRE